MTVCNPNGQPVCANNFSFGCSLKYCDKGDMLCQLENTYTKASIIKWNVKKRDNVKGVPHRDESTDNYLNLQLSSASQ